MSLTTVHCVMPAVNDVFLPFLTSLALCDLYVCFSVCVSKHSLGSHEYVQNCRKWENEITLQLLSHSTMRRDLARTVSPFNKLNYELFVGGLTSRLHDEFQVYQKDRDEMKDMS